MLVGTGIRITPAAASALAPSGPEAGVPAKGKSTLAEQTARVKARNKRNTVTRRLTIGEPY
jgi:hypothetical protein